MRGRGILILSPFFPPNIGGVETHLNDLCDSLARHGNRVYVYTYKPLTRQVKAASFEKRGNLEIRRMSWLGHGMFDRLEPSVLLEFLYLTPALLFFSVFHLFQTRDKVDVIHSHGLNAAFIGIFLSKIFQKRCVVSIHTIYGLSRRPMLSKLMRVVLSNCDVVLTMAERSKLELVEAGVNEHKVKIFTYWVDQTKFRPLNRGECKTAMGLANKFVVFFVGRLLEIKGVVTFLEAARKLSCEPGLTFLIAGDGPYREHVITVSKILPNIVYLGPVPNTDLPTYYNVADLTVVPSLYEEGYGRVILESLSCGTPVVASNRGGILEALEPSVGMTIEPTVDNLVRAILTLFENRELLQKMATDCSPYARLKFNERNVRLIIDSYS